MRSSQLQLQQYDSDKIASRYLEQYDEVLSPWVDKEIRLLELGIHKGGSLMLWKDYFCKGVISGIDIKLPSDFPPSERVRLFKGSQGDRQFLTDVANKVAPGGFDIIIDDASHMGDLTKIAFWHLFDHHLKPGGLYVIEDWGTGYWSDWPDGRRLDLDAISRTSLWTRIARMLHLKMPMQCHSHGMVGFVKQLIDEQAAADVTRGKFKSMPTRQSKFESVTIMPSIVFVKKAGGGKERED